MHPRLRPAFPARCHRCFSVCSVPVAAFTFACLALMPQPGHALPTGGQLVAGNVTTTLNGSQLTLNQASRAAIMNWQQFNIAPNEMVRLLQSGPDAALLARVTGGNPTELLGRLQADGKLFLINPKGVVVGQGAVIDTAAFLASTLDVADADFLKGGPLTFKGDSAAGVVNLGKITAREGNVLLLAHTVKNSGEISADRGTAGLGAGTEVCLASPDAPLFVIKTNLPAATEETGVDNSGLITAAQAQLEAAGGSLFDLAVNHSGVIRATGVEHRPDGRILLTAGSGNVSVTGTATARAADGSGGEILVGGDYQGKNPAVANATNTVVTPTAQLDASAASATGDGGRVIVWADRNTRFLGSLRATGAKGGFAEVSGRGYLDFNPRAVVNLGRDGTLLLDPDSLRINSAFPDENNVPTDPGPPFVFGGIDSSSRLRVSTLEAQLANTNVILDTSTRSGDITFESSVSWSTASTLRVNSGNNIVISGSVNISGTAGTLELYSGRRGAAFDQLLGAFTLTGDIVQGAGGTIAVNTLTVGQNPAANFSGPPANPTVYDNPSRSGSATFNGILNVLTLQKDLGANTGALTATNSSNTIGTFQTTGSGGDTGNIDVVDGGSSLSVMLALPAITASSVRVVTPGDLNLASGTAISFANPTGDVILAANGGAFINAAGASAIGANARHLIYTSTAAATGKGGLGGTNVGNHPYDPNETFADTTSRFFFTGAAPIVLNLTYSANSVSRAYGSANPASFGFSVTGFDPGVTNDVTGAPALSTSATLTSGVGGYTIGITQGTLASSNYGFVFSPGTLTVTAAPVTIAVNNASRLYGAANPAFSGAYTTGLMNGDPQSALGTWSFATGASATSGVSNYAITGSTGGASANYAVTFTPGVLSVTPAPLNVAVDNATRIYGGSNPGFSATPTGLVNGDTLTGAVPNLAFSTPATPASSVGGYAITATGTSSNYTPTFVSGALSVTPASLLVMANNATRVYGDPDPAFTAAITGFVNGDSAGVVSGLAFASSATVTSGVGNYTITPSGGTAANYSLSYAPATLVVTKAPLTVTIADATREYGHGNPTFGIGAITGLKNGDTSAVIQNLAFNPLPPPNQLPGSFSAILASGTAANYDLTWFAGTLSIVKAPATIGIGSASRVYGTDPVTVTPTFVGFLPVDEATVRSNWSFTNPDTLSLGAGSYPLAFSVLNQGLAASLGALYDITVQTGTLTIRPAPLTIRPQDAARTYGDPNPAFEAAIFGLRLKDPASVISGLTFASAPATAAAGSYAITASGASAANYTISYEPGTLTVNKATLTVRPDDASRLYGDPNPAFSAAITGYRNGDTAGVVSGLTVTSTATVASPAGAHAITAGGATAANYTFSYSPGTLTVDQVPLTVTVANASRIYGAADPAFQIASATGLKNGDTTGAISNLAFTTTFNSAPVGAYEIGATGTAANYRITFVPGTLTVTKAPLTIQADSPTMAYGDSLPAFGYTFSGLMPFDSPSVVTGVQLEPMIFTGANPPGLYPLTFSSSGTARNYAITAIPGTLEMTRRAIVVEAQPASSIAGAVPATFAVAAPSPILGGPQFSFAGKTNATNQSRAGDYQIVPILVLSSQTTQAEFDRFYTYDVKRAVLTLRPSGANEIELHQGTVTNGDMVFTFDPNGPPADLAKNTEVAGMFVTPEESVRRQISAAVSSGGSLGQALHQHAADAASRVADHLAGRGPALAPDLVAFLVAVRDGGMTEDLFWRAVRAEGGAEVVAGYLAETVFSYDEDWEALAMASAQKVWAERVAAAREVYDREVADALAQYKAGIDEFNRDAENRDTKAYSAILETAEKFEVVRGDLEGGYNSGLEAAMRRYNETLDQTTSLYIRFGISKVPQSGVAYLAQVLVERAGSTP